jgi:serine/threonine protein kinase
MPEARDSVLLSDVQRIEASTPFIKEAFDESTLTTEQIELERMLSNIAKQDIEFIMTKEANLGKGSYGEVQLARHKTTGVMLAIKKIEKASISSSKIRETLIREIRIQKQLNHEYICRLYGSFEDKTTIYLALEYASKGNLFYLVRREKFLSEDTAFYFFI